MVMVQQFMVVNYVPVFVQENILLFLTKMMNQKDATNMNLLTLNASDPPGQARRAGDL